ncbi:transposase [Streptomyces sp. NPDC088915]|uniref:transposase n=1 Tax=Streptomyces sp. NPDC088915 TaxID=3365912 RepID=UPI0038011682
MRADLLKRLVSDGLWEQAAPLLPSFAARPQGGGTAPRDERAVFMAVVYALTSGCAWRYLPESFGVSPATAHRLVVAVSGADLYDSQAFKSLILGMPAIRSRHGPRRGRPVRIRADKAYYFAEHLRRLCDRRLTIRYERKGNHSLAFLGLAAALTCYKRLAKLTA